MVEISEGKTVALSLVTVAVVIAFAFVLSDKLQQTYESGYNAGFYDKNLQCTWTCNCDEKCLNMTSGIVVGLIKGDAWVCQTLMEKDQNARLQNIAAAVWLPKQHCEKFVREVNGWDGYVLGWKK